LDINEYSELGERRPKTRRLTHSTLKIAQWGGLFRMFRRAMRMGRSSSDRGRHSQFFACCGFYEMEISPMNGDNRQSN
jgi:hypothetical protein